VENLVKFLQDIPEDQLGRVMRTFMEKKFAPRNRSLFAFTYWKQSIEDEKRSIDKKKVDVSLFVLNAFLFGLWLVRDYSAKVDMTLFKLIDEEYIYPLMVSRDLTYFDNRGNSSTSILLPAELKKAGQNMMSYMSIAKTHDKMLSPNKGTSRHIRLFHLIDLARREENHEIKLSFYVSALEAMLVRRSDSEIKHRVAERVACLLGKCKKERVELFATTGRAYKARSAFVHGQKFVGADEELALVSEECDSIVRRLLAIRNNKFVNPKLTDDSVKDEELNSYFMDLLFRQRRN
jgi:hypothetical protein